MGRGRELEPHHLPLSLFHLPGCPGDGHLELLSYFWTARRDTSSPEFVHHHLLHWGSLALLQTACRFPSCRRAGRRGASIPCPSSAARAEQDARLFWDFVQPSAH